MLKKSIILLTLFFLLQTISSCFDCPDIESYNVNYTGVKINAFNTAGFYDVAVMETDTIYKNAFGLTVGMIIEMEQTAQNFEKWNAFAFQSAAAMINDCPGPFYYYVDSIENLRIFASVSDTSEVYDYTQRFGTFDYAGNLISVEKLLEIRAEWHNGFQFQFIDFNEIPDKLIFSVEVTMESGNVYSAKTSTVHFY
jgi:hypothetical protein